MAEVAQQREDLREHLSLLKRILQAQLDVDLTSNKGAKATWDETRTLSTLEQRSLETKTSLSHFLDVELFDCEALMPVFRKVATILVASYPDKKGLTTLLTDIDKNDYMQLIEHVLKEEESAIVKYADSVEVEPSQLFFVLTTPLQPFFEELARRVSPLFYERWWAAHCPVCGRKPVVARIRNRKRYLMCSFCGAEYLSDYILCVHCGNQDPYTLNYLRVEGKPEFEIDFCAKCKRYLKVIKEAALNEPIPPCLQDILTLELDIEAKKAGLIRT